MSFSAGFAKGFTNTIIEGIEGAKERMQDLVDQGIASAKAVAPRYAQATAEYKNILEIGDMMKTKYNVTDDEFVALTQGTDITQLYKNIITEDANRIASGRSSVRKEDFINVIDMPKEALPKYTTRDQAIARIMGIQSLMLDKEEDPKSEAAQTRTGAASLAEFLGLNPKMSAEKQLETMKVMGYDVSDLEYFQSTQGMKQKVIPGVTRTRDILFDDIDYDKGSYDSTQRKFNSMFATRLAGADISNPDIFRTTTGIEPDNKQVMRDNALEASMAMSKLELEIVNSGSGLGLIGPAARRNLLEGIFSQIDGGTAGVAELQSLMSNVENGKAIAAINSIYNEKGRFSAEDYAFIINGVVPEVKETSSEKIIDSEPVVEQTKDIFKGGRSSSGSFDEVSEVTDAEKILDEVLEEPEIEVLSESPVAPEVEDKEVEELQSKIKAETDAVVKNALKKELEQIQAEAEQPPAIASARAVAKRNLENQASMREAMASISKADWKELSRKERKDAGLPVRNLDMWFAGSDAFMNEVDSEADEPGEIKTTRNFIDAYNNDIISFLREDGFTGEEEEEEFKFALAAWFEENSGNLDIPTMSYGNDIDLMAKIYKQVISNIRQ
tara:strand:+ start:169 stop:2007 length:1839 start_codon:yes stop_codon:yes gene_type:complete